MKRIVLVMLAACLALPLAAQQASQPAAQATPNSPEVPKLVESIDVRVINVDVVVTDKKGNPINGLTKDDFEVLENGVAKPISNFYEVQGKRDVAPPPVVQPTNPLFLQALLGGGGTADLAGDHDALGGDQGLAGHAGVGVGGQEGVDNGVRQAVGDLVRVTFGDAFAGEDIGGTGQGQTPQAGRRYRPRVRDHI